jgi:hypothetical protein
VKVGGEGGYQKHGFLRRWRRGVAREEEDVEGTREPKDVKGGRRKRMR